MRPSYFRTLVYYQNIPFATMPKFFNALLILFLITAAKSPAPFEVQYHGALRLMMHQGDLSAQADLRDYQGRKHFYALGAVAGLQGEILVWDGKPLVTSVQEEQLRVSRSFEHEASLLVHSEVAHWQETKLTDRIADLSALESQVVKAAAAAGIDTSEPFPFLLRGSAEVLSWHVIDWPAGDTEHSHQKHLESGLQGSLRNQPVEILGFYSQKHHGVFTHHSRQVHLHFQAEDRSLAGHVDAFSAGDGMTLALPLAGD